MIFTGVMRCELSKAPWRNVGLWRTFVERYPTVPAAFFWLSAPRPRPTRAQATRWAQDYRWPLDHRAGEGYDLRPEEDGLWQSIARLNRDFDGRATMYYINQFGWSADVLGALDPGAATFGDLRCGADVEVGLSIYEPFGIAPLEPFAAGATCLLSDSCGCARHLESLGLADQVLLGAFSRHHFSPREVDARRLQRIEQAAYDGLVTALGERLGLSEPRLDAGPWRQRRATRIAAAQQAVKRLSWAAAVEHGLLPALT